MDFKTLFNYAMDRDAGEIYPFPVGTILNLGAGNKFIPGTVSMDYPVWDADTDQIPYSDNSIDGIIAFHFLEHCTDPVWILQESQRVLKSGCLMTICVPYYSSQMQAQDLDHKHQFCEETWKVLFENSYYDKNRINWQFDIGFNLICGIKERNLCLLTQLIKR